MFSLRDGISDVLCDLKVCNGSANATHMECRAPALSNGTTEEKPDAGEIFIHVNEKSNLWSGRFDYQPTVKVIPFENEDNLLWLKPGENEVSLHVCSRAPPHPLHDLAAVKKLSWRLSGPLISVPAAA